MNSNKLYRLAFLFVFITQSGAVLGDARIVLLAEADVDVFEATPDRTEPITGLLSVGVGRGLKVGRLISYIRFDLSRLPLSNLIDDLSIESAQLRLLAQSFGLASLENSRFFVTVSACADNNWSEATMTWKNRVCKEDLQGEDSLVVQGKNLPAVFTWDVTQSIAKAHAQNAGKVTFVIKAFLLQQASREIIPGQRFGPESSVGFVRFWSRERSDYGVSAVPTLVVNHSTSSTVFVDFIRSLAAILSAIGVAFGIYGVIRTTRKRRESQNK